MACKILYKGLDHFVIHRDVMNRYDLIDKIGEGGQAAVIKI